MSAQDARGPMRTTRRTLIVSALTEPDIPTLVYVRRSEVSAYERGSPEPLMGDRKPKEERLRTAGTKAAHSPSSNLTYFKCSLTTQAALDTVGAGFALDAMKHVTHD